MRVTQSAVDHLNRMAEEMPTSTPCLNISLKRSGCSSYKLNFDMLDQYPEEFDIEWFSITESGWGFFVVFHDARLFDSTLDYRTTDQFNTELILDIAGAKNTCGCGESFNL